jgi:hypothetical protein
MLLRAPSPDLRKMRTFLSFDKLVRQARDWRHPTGICRPMRKPAEIHYLNANIRCGK